MPEKVLIVAAEASAELHGARLVEEFRRIRPDVSFVGVGGVRMRAAGVETLFDPEYVAVVGFIEVIGGISRIVKMYRGLKKALADPEIRLVILMDYPDFNIFFARSVRRRGVPIFYYITPQVWAWRRYRARKLARRATKLGVIFPFEREFFTRYGAAVEFVGHPLLDGLEPPPPRESFLKGLGLDPKKRTITLMPGSRRSEIRLHLETLLETARLLAGRFGDLQFILPIAETLSAGPIRARIEAMGLPAAAPVGDSLPSLAHSEAAVIAAGTATLEAMLAETPFVMIYRGTWFTYGIFLFLVKTRLYSWPNLLSGRRIVPELVMKDFRAPRVSDEIAHILLDPEHAGAIRLGMKEALATVGERGASRRAAEIAAGMLAKEVAPREAAR